MLRNMTHKVQTSSHSTGVWVDNSDITTNDLLKQILLEKSFVLFALNAQEQELTTRDVPLARRQTMTDEVSILCTIN